MLGLHFVLIGVILTPWTVRNYLIFGKPIYSADSIGYGLWRGHNESTRGSGETDQVPDSLQQKLLSLERNDRMERERERVFLREALAYIQTHPLREMSLALRKVLLFWVFEFTM